MTPIIVEGVELLEVKTLPSFECNNCECNKTGCIRIDSVTKAPYFDKGSFPNRNNLLYCINQEVDIVFIKNTPKQIAKYVAARLEAT